jgi:hypothetical protein
MDIFNVDWQWVHPGSHGLWVTSFVSLIVSMMMLSIYSFTFVLERLPLPICTPDSWKRNLAILATIIWGFGTAYLVFLNVNERHPAFFFGLMSSVFTLFIPFVGGRLVYDMKISGNIAAGTALLSIIIGAISCIMSGGTISFQPWMIILFPVLLTGTVIFMGSPTVVYKRWSQ